MLNDRLDSFPFQLLEAALSIAEGINEPKRNDACIIIASACDRLGYRESFASPAENRALKILELILERLDLIESYPDRKSIEVINCHSEPSLRDASRSLCSIEHDILDFSNNLLGINLSIDRNL